MNKQRTSVGSWKERMRVDMQYYKNSTDAEGYFYQAFFKFSLIWFFYNVELAMLSKGQDINGPKTQILTANFVYEMNIPKFILYRDFFT